MRVILFRLLTVGLILLLSGCASLQAKLEKPTISAVSIALKNANSGNPSLELTLTLNNPNALPIPITKLAAGLSINAQEIIQGETKENVTLPAKGEAKLTLLLSTSLNKLLPALKSWAKNPGAGLPYQLTGNVFVPLKSGGLPFSYQGRWVPPSLF